MTMPIATSRMTWLVIITLLAGMILVAICKAQEPVSIIQVIQDKTAEIQALVDGAPGGIVDIDLTPFDNCGITSVNIGENIQSFRVHATRPIELYMLPLTKMVGGQPVSISKGMWHVQHGSSSGTTAEFSLPYFESDENITYDGCATVMRDPLQSDQYHSPLGILRPIFYQIGYKDGSIKRFVWRSPIRNHAKAAIHLCDVESGLIDCTIKNGNRHCLGIIYKQGVTPYNLVVNLTVDNVSAPFDFSVPSPKTLKRTVTPSATVTVKATNVWWRTKIHGHWNIDAKLDMTADGRLGYAGFDVANETIGLVRLHDSRFSGYPSQCIGWNHSEGTLEIERITFIDSYTPIVPSGVQQTPVVLRGPMMYEDCVVIKPTAGDIYTTNKTSGMTATEIDAQWLSRMRSACDSFKAENLPPTWWYGKLFYKPMPIYAASIGWNGTEWQ